MSDYIFISQSLIKFSIPFHYQGRQQGLTGLAVAVIFHYKKITTYFHASLMTVLDLVVLSHIFFLKKANHDTHCARLERYST